MTHQTTSDARRVGLMALAALAFAPILLIGGCGSVQPNYYTLTPSPGTPRGGGPLDVEVQTPTVAGYLSRDYIVLNSDANQLHLAQNAAWAEPLPEAIGSALALDLSQRLPGSNVYTADSGISAKPEAIVELNVSRFAEDNAGQAEIVATVSVHRPDATMADISPLRAVTPLKDNSVGALAASLSQSLGQVADKVAADLHAMRAKRPATTAAGTGS